MSQELRGHELAWRRDHHVIVRTPTCLRRRLEARLEGASARFVASDFMTGRRFWSPLGWWGFGEAFDGGVADQREIMVWADVCQREGAKS